MSNKKIYIYIIIATLLVVNYGIFKYNSIPTNPSLIRIDNQDISLGNSGIESPVFFRRNGNQVFTTNAAWDFAVGGATSASADFAVDPGNNTIQFSQFTNCNLDTDGSGFLVCGTDATGGGSATSYIDVGANSIYHQTGSLSFDAGHFDVGYTASISTVKLDWLSGGGPASKSQANTWTALNVFSAGASVSGGTFEVTNTASIGGNVTIQGDLTVNSGNHIYLHGLQAVDTAGIHLHSQNGTEIGFLGTANTANVTWNGTNLFNGVTTDITTGTNENLTIAPNGTGITQITGYASISQALEVGNYASASLFMGSAFSGNPDCNDAGEKILWSAGLFTCGSDAGGTTGSNNQMLTDDGAGGIVSEANLTFDGSLLDLTGMASISTNFEADGYASASKLIMGLGAVGTPGLTFNGDTDTGLYWGGANEIDITTGGAQLARLRSGSIDMASLKDFVNAQTGSYALEGSTGLVSAPTYAFSNDLNTGMWSSGADVLNFTTGGTNRASLSASIFELNSTIASISGQFKQTTVASNSFLGSLTGPTTGTLSVGTSDNPLKILWANIVRIVTQLFIPTYSGTTLSGTGNTAVHLASGSQDYNDGSNTIINRNKKCATVFIESPTSANNRWMDIGAFDDPVTLTDVFLVNASGSNGAKWALYFGTPAIIRGATTSMTTVFSSHRVASAASTQIRYTNFTNSSIPDGNILDVYIPSTSATLEKFTIKYCYRYTH